MGRDQSWRVSLSGLLFQFTRPHGARPRASPARRPSRLGFNSRARMGRDTRWPLEGWTLSCFNSRARMGRDFNPLLNNLQGISFNSRARMGRDRYARELGRGGAWFQFTRPHGARRMVIHITHPDKRFNSRARMGRDLERSAACRLQRDVSIHAPAWGATTTARRRKRPRMFQFTRPHGARRARTSWRRGRHCFNSRARMGRDAAGTAPNESREFQFTRPHGARLARLITR